MTGSPQRPEGRQRVGVLGSAFNPPHIGHLILAQEASAALGLEEVLLVPTGEAPHKRIEPEPGPGVRMALAEAAAAAGDRLRAISAEIDRDGPSYAYLTLEQLAVEMPEIEFWWVMGADAALGLPDWRAPERVAELARLGVAQRPGVDGGEVLAALHRIGAAERAELITMPQIGVSSSLVRDRVREGMPIRHLVPDAVAALIEKEDLYR